MQPGITTPDFYGNVVYKLCKIMGNGKLSYTFTKTIKRFINRGYGPNILRHTACLVVMVWYIVYYTFSPSTSLYAS